MSLLSLLKDIFFEKEEDIPESSIVPHNLTQHYKNELHTMYIDEVYVVLPYRAIESRLESYKYRSERSYDYLFASYFEILIGSIIERQSWSPVPVCIPVPMHWSRYFFRGFDHMERIVSKVAQKMDYPYISPLSTWFSFRQSQLSKKKRLENRKNHFTMKNHVHLRETIFLFDDVISTWATANECAKILKQHGAKRVIGLFLASNAL